VQAVQAQYQFQQVTLDLLLDAQRRRAEAESAYYRSLVDYNRAIMNVHYRKGSLLDYDGVYLAEGPWPAKAYFDAMRQARKRDAGLYIDYGYTRPNVVSRGPIEQGCNEGCNPDGTRKEIFGAPGQMPDEAAPAELPLPNVTPGGAATPPMGSSSSVEMPTNEQQANRSHHPAAEYAAIWRRPQLLEPRQGLWRQASHDTSRLSNAA
jgi:hypothetical protein